MAEPVQQTVCLGQSPPELGKLANLEYLSIDNNRWLTGCVPANLRAAYEEANGDDYPICQASSATATPVPATPTPTPTAPTATCNSAVTDRSNTGLVADCNALLAAKDNAEGHGGAELGVGHIHRQVGWHRPWGKSP